MPKTTMIQEFIQAQKGWKVYDTVYVNETELKNEPYYEMGCCFYNAIINKNYHYAGMKLRVVFGGFRIGPRFIYGGPDPKTLPLPSQNDEGWDIHAWLEDDEGRIYDCLYDEIVNKVPKANRKAMKAGVMEGRTRDELKDMNCFYNAYNMDSQLLWGVTIFSVFLRKRAAPWDVKHADVHERFINEVVDTVTTSKTKASKFRAEIGQTLFNRIRKEIMPVLSTRHEGGIAIPKAIATVLA
jgi:hypothetical protein